nr:RecName: Full=Uncharacterized protein IMPP14 [Nautilus macromphalus]
VTAKAVAAAEAASSAR